MNETKPKFDAIPLTPPPLPGERPQPPAPSKPDPILFGAQPVEKAAPKKSTHHEPTPTINTPVTPSAPLPGSNVPDWLKTLFVPTRSHAILAVAATSLFGGWYGVKTLFPPSIDRGSGSVAKAESNEPSELPKSLVELPKPVEPSLPNFELSLPTSATPTPQPPDSTQSLSLPVPVESGKPDIRPVNHSEPAAVTLQQPVSPPPPPPPSGTPMLPPAVGATDLPSTTPSHAQVVPEPAHHKITVPGATDLPTPVSPSPATITPVGGPPPAVVLPTLPLGTESKAPEIKIDLPAPSAATPAPTPATTQPQPQPQPLLTLPTPGGATAPSTPAPTATQPPVTLPTSTTPLPTTTPPPSPTATVPHNLLDLNMGAKPAPAPAPITITPVSSTPTTLPGTMTGAGTVTPTTTLTTPPAVTPAAGTATSAAALTDFDVDLHYVKPGESFGSIAKQHYGDERYGQALEQFNRRGGSFDGRVVQVPPTHWIRKQVNPNSGMISAPAPSPTSAPAPSSSGSTDWTGVSSTNADRFYELTSNRTFRDLAKEAYGSEQEWQRIFNLNPNYPSDAVLPAGTRIRLSADSRIGR